MLDEDSRRIEVIVPDAQLSLAIGRRGQNVRLASQLTGWDIDIVTESEDAERRSREFKALTEYFVEALNVEEVIAQLLVTEGFSRVDELVYVELDELASIQGFDESIAEALRERAETYLAEQERALRQEAAELGLGEDLLEFEALTPRDHRRARPQGHQVAGRSGRSGGRRADRAAARRRADRGGRRRADHGRARPLVRDRGRATAAAEATAERRPTLRPMPATRPMPSRGGGGRWRPVAEAGGEAERLPESGRDAGGAARWPNGPRTRCAAAW